MPAVLEEIKNTLKNQYCDIWDVVFDAQKNSLASLERGIQSLEDRPEDQQKLIAAYIATIKVGAETYKRKVGVRFSIHIEEDFIAKAISNDKLFTKDGKYIGVQKNSVHSVRISDDFHSIDLCFGLYEDIKNLITSQYFILFYREDITDYDLLHYLNDMKKQNENRWTKSMVVNLLEDGIMFRRDIKDEEQDN